jgi:hypothetical protein
MPDILSAVAVANEFRQEIALLDAAAAQSMLDAWRGVESSLLAEMEKFAGRLKGKPVKTWQLYRMKRYQELLAQVEMQLTALEKAVAPTITAGQVQAAQLGAQMATTTLDALGYGVSFNTLPAAAVENVTALARAGRPLSALLQPMYGAAADGITRELIAGIAIGKGPREIARRMAQGGLTDALDHLLLVTRDQYNRAHRAAALQRYADTEAVYGYVRRCARQAGRTCIACVSLDGKFYELDKPFEAHPQCRCVMIPAIKGVTWKSRLNSGQEWFSELSEAEKIATMGKGRYEQWKGGRLSWDTIVKRTEHPVWGVSATPAPLSG